MNNTFFLWLLFLPLFATAQTQTVTVDSSWITNEGGDFYQARYQEYSTGDRVTTFTRIGDTLTAFNRFQEAIVSQGNNLSADAAVVYEHRARVTELIRFGKTLPSIIGKSPLDSIRKVEPTILDVSGWTIRTGNLSTGLRFRVTGAGIFQWKADTTATWRPAAFLGAVIRLNSLNGYTTDFFKSGNRWRTVDGRYQIRKAGDSANRDLSPEDVPDSSKQPSGTELLDKGVVRIGEQKWKYNSSKKKWEQL